VETELDGQSVAAKAGANAAVAVDELRSMARQFAQDATNGVEGTIWVDAITGERAPCHYRLEPALRELHFCPGALPRPPDASQALKSCTSNTSAVESLSPAAVSSAASSPRRRGRSADGKGVGGVEAASGSTTASSWRPAHPYGDSGPPMAVNQVSLAEASAVVAGVEASAGSSSPLPLCCVSLAGVQDVFRPEERPDFCEVHSWYVRLSREDQECLVCIRHRPSLGSVGAGEGPEGGALASETVLFLERSALARERFVVCAKVLHLSVI